ncbi:hypothetical protein ACFL0J_08655 [Candidatus Neomarinimicrobiota bacterium]
MKKSETNKDKPLNDQNIKSKNKDSESFLEYSLVIFMLKILLILVVLIILFPIFMVRCFEFQVEEYTKFIDFSKWVLTALLAAFGAWIGAGAAYFFGSKNLRESSESTQRALEVMQNPVKSSSLVRDIKPTPLNADFTFSSDTTVKDVIEKLSKYVDYWFVPIIDNERLKDTIHKVAFLQYNKDEKVNPKKDGKISDLIKYIKDGKIEQEKRKRFNRFFAEFSMDDSVPKVSTMMYEKDAEVGIVCDKDNKPTHCFSIRDLILFERGNK